MGKEQRRGGAPEGNKAFSMLFFFKLFKNDIVQKLKLKVNRLATLVHLDYIATHCNKLLGVIASLGLE